MEGGRWESKMQEYREKGTTPLSLPIPRSQMKIDCCLAASKSQIMDEIDFFVEEEIFQSKVVNERS